jgi:hypothetical protein
MLASSKMLKIFVLTLFAVLLLTGLSPTISTASARYPVYVTSPPTSVAVVVVVSAEGGATNPGPGTYTLINATSLELTATPLSGWKFDNWVIGGYPRSSGVYSVTDTLTSNPYNVNYGYGYVYTYQPVFSLISSSSATPTPTTPEFSSASAILVAVALAAVLVISGAYAYRRRQ